MMRSVNSKQLLEQLQADVRQLVLATSYLQKEDPELLLTAPGPSRWSIVQVLDHLNSYGRYYIPAIERSLQADKPGTETFTPGWFGDYFTNINKPDELGKIKSRMSAPKDHRPAGDVDIKPVMDIFYSQQQQLLNLLEKAKQKNIGAIRTPISISRFIKLKVGDTFRFLIAHEKRHFVQIENTRSDLNHTKGKSPAGHPAVQQAPAFLND
jgi:hypothetical protein